MLASDRQIQIANFVRIQGAARTTEIAQRFGVTEETVRRDFETLHGQGLLQRTHGGAVALDHPRRSLTAKERSVRNVEAKRSIAQVAAELVGPREIIFVDASSTALQFVNALPNIEIKIVTNAHDVIAAVADRDLITVVGTGGTFDPNSRSYVGPQVEACTERYHITKMFLSCDGIDPEKGASEQDEAQATLKAHIIKHADASYLLADSSKWGRRSAYYFCPPGNITAVVMESVEALGDEAGASNFTILTPRLP